MQTPDLSRAKRIAVDIETKDPNLKTLGPGTYNGTGHVIGVSIAVDGFAEYYPLRHASGNLTANQQQGFWQWLKASLSSGAEVVGTALQYDLDYLCNVHGVNVTGRILDVQDAEALIDENQRSYSLDNIAKRRIGERKAVSGPEQWAATHLTKTEAKNWKAHLWRMPADVVRDYAIADADLPLRVIAVQERIMADQGLLPVFDVECGLTPMLLAMRKRGVHIDTERVSTLGKEMRAKQLRAQQRLNVIAGFDVNTNAASDLVRMFNTLGIRYGVTEKGNPSFTKEFLKTVTHPVGELIRTIRDAEKLAGTFIEGYLTEHVVGDRIHTQYHKTKKDDYGTVSGRFSSSTPNLQNIPARGPLSKMIRACFTPDGDDEWVKIDWSQIEYRLLLHYAATIPSAAATLAIFNANPRMDFHQMVADLVGLERGPAKNINFGLVYGMGIQALADALGVDVEEAKRLSGIYHGRAPFVREIYDRVSAKAQRTGHIRTILGRRRRFEEWEPAGYNRRGSALPRVAALAEYGPNIRRAFTHKALNALLQGSAADMMKLAMVQIWRSGVCDVLGAPLLTVHDELDWSKPRTKAADEAIREVVHIMETVFADVLRVKIIAEAEFGPTWGEVHK